MRRGNITKKPLLNLYFLPDTKPKAPTPSTPEELRRDYLRRAAELEKLAEEEKEILRNLESWKSVKNLLKVLEHREEDTAPETWKAAKRIEEEIKEQRARVKRNEEEALLHRRRAASIKRQTGEANQ